MVEDFTAADIEAALGEPFAPPPTDAPACRALYWHHTCDALEARFGKDRVLDGILLAGGFPNPVEKLVREVARFRNGKTQSDIIALAKEEMSKWP